MDHNSHINFGILPNRSKLARVLIIIPEKILKATIWRGPRFFDRYLRRNHRSRTHLRNPRYSESAESMEIPVISIVGASG